MENGEGTTGGTTPNNETQGNEGSKTPVQPGATKPNAEKVDISKLSDQNPNIIELDWGAAEQGKENAFFKGPTKQVENAPGTHPGSNQNNSSNTSGSKPSNYRVGIKVLVAIIDFAMSTICQKIAKDSSPTPYQAEPNNKQILEDSIVAILDESKVVKIPTWLIVLFAFLSAYGFQIMAAIESRKNSKSPSTNQDTSMKAGVFSKDGKMYRRYANGSEREMKFDKDGVEILIGQPTLKTRTTRVHKQAA